MCAARASRAMRREAAFLWMMPLEAALARVLTALFNAAPEPGSPLAKASRALFTADLSPVRTLALRARRFWD